MYGKAAQALLEFFLESNHSLSDDPFLPSLFPSALFPLPPSNQPSQPDKHRCPMWGEKTPPEKIEKPTLTSKSHLHFEQRNRVYFLVLNNESSVTGNLELLEEQKQMQQALM